MEINNNEMSFGALKKARDTLTDLNTTKIKEEEVKYKNLANTADSVTLSAEAVMLMSGGDGNGERPIKPK